MEKQHNHEWIFLKVNNFIGYIFVYSLISKPHQNGFKCMWKSSLHCVKRNVLLIVVSKWQCKAQPREQESCNKVIVI